MMGGAVASLALAVVACGGSGAKDSAKAFSGDQQDAATTIEELESATEEGDISRICNEIISKKAIEAASKSGEKCEDQGAGELREQVKRAGGKDRFDLDVKKVEISGSRAQAQVASKEGDRSRTTTIPLVKEDEGWRIAAEEGGP